MCAEYVNSRRLMLELLRERNSLIVQGFFFFFRLRLDIFILLAACSMHQGFQSVLTTTTISSQASVLKVTDFLRHFPQNRWASSNCLLKIALIIKQMRKIRKLTSVAV